MSAHQMLVTNLRNRPLSDDNLKSLEDLNLGLYHNLVTGHKEFPSVLARSFLHSILLNTPFIQDRHGENATPSPLTDLPGLMTPPASSDLPSQILTPVLPVKADLFVLKADRRNCVRTLDIDGLTVNRVISPVYYTNETEMTNRWRVTDYDTEGNMLMSVLCQFSKRSEQRAKRRAPEDESSSRSPAPPRKRLRM